MKKTASFVVFNVLLGMGASVCATTPEYSLSSDQPLLLSALPGHVLQSFKLHDTPFYASGHSVYDTRIVLNDSQGKEVSTLFDFRIKQTYTLKMLGQNTELPAMIWFFSPEGEEAGEVTQDNILSKCTAEAPCKNITQKIIDNLPEDKHHALWLASGDYNLSQNNGILRLKDNLSIVGRTDNFTRSAYGRDRPNLNGTLAWFNYTKHEGTGGSLMNLKIKTDDISFEGSDLHRKSTNVFATGAVSVFNTELKEINKSTIFATNIDASVAYIAESTLDEKTDRGSNIFADQAHIFDSAINIETSSDGGNISHFSFLIMNSSTLNLKTSSCYANAIIGEMDAENTSYLSDSKINIQVTASPESSYYCAIAGIYLNKISSDVSKQGFLDMYRTEMNIESSGAGVVVVGIHAANIPVHLSGFKAHIEANNYAAAVIIAREVRFLEEPSAIEVLSETATNIFSDDTQVKNESTPLSQCRVNGFLNEC